MDFNATSFILNYNGSNNNFNTNNSSTNTSQSNTNPQDPQYFCWYYRKVSLFTIIFISIWGLLILPAIYCLYSQVRSDRVVPVFIINLLISDIIQICCMIVQMTNVEDDLIKYIFIYHIYYAGVMASVFFMTFIAMERYLLISWPSWYRFQRKLKVSASVSVVNWILSVFIGLNNGFWIASVLVIPLLLLIFFLVRSVKGLSTSHNVPPDERRQIIAVLTVVVFAYILTFLPRILAEFLIWGGWWRLWLWDSTTYKYFDNVACTFLQINPLTDLLLYIFIKNVQKLLAFLCGCRKTNSGNQQRESITETTCSWSASQGPTD